MRKVCGAVLSILSAKKAKGKGRKKGDKNKPKAKSELPKISVEDAKKIMSVPINPEKSRLFSYKVFK